MDYPGRNMLGRNAGTSSGGLDSYLSSFEKMAEQSRVENLAREQEIRSIFDDIISRYSESGTYKAGMTKEIETRKEADIGKEIQQMISSGIYNTSMPAGLSNKWESEVGTTARLKLEDLLQERVINAQIQKANFINSIENEYPDYSTIASLAGQASQGGSYGGGGFYSGGTSYNNSFQSWSDRNPPITPTYERNTSYSGGYQGSEYAGLNPTSSTQSKYPTSSYSGTPVSNTGTHYNYTPSSSYYSNIPVPSYPTTTKTTASKYSLPIYSNYGGF